MVDIKTGKNIYSDHANQLGLYQEMFNEKYGDIFPVTHIYNWRPKPWRTPTGMLYELKNQTETKSIAKNPDYINIARKDGLFNPAREIESFEGFLVLGEDPRDIYTTQTLEEHIMHKHEQFARDQVENELNREHLFSGTGVLDDIEPVKMEKQGEDLKTHDSFKDSKEEEENLPF